MLSTWAVRRAGPIFTPCCNIPLLRRTTFAGEGASMERAFPACAREGIPSPEAMRAPPSESLRPVRTRPPYPGSLLSAPRGADGIGRDPIFHRLQVLRAAFASLPCQTRIPVRRCCSSGRLFRQGCQARRPAAQGSHTRARSTSASMRRGRCIGPPMPPIRPRPIGASPCACLAQPSTPQARLLFPPCG